MFGCESNNSTLKLVAASLGQEALRVKAGGISAAFLMPQVVHCSHHQVRMHEEFATFHEWSTEAVGCSIQTSCSWVSLQTPSPCTAGLGSVQASAGANLALPVAPDGMELRSKRQHASHAIPSRGERSMLRGHIEDRRYRRAVIP